MSLLKSFGQIEQTTLDLVLEEDEEYEIENTGKKYVVHLFQ